MKVIASHNGLAAVRLAYEELLRGVDTLDACVAGVTLIEDDPAEMTVGYGGLPNEEGIVELDAAVMHGPTHRAGAVAALQNVRHPTQVARLVMQQTNRVLLVGEGALAFARSQGFREENLLTEAARQRWLTWKRSRTDSDWLPPNASPQPPVEPDFRRPTGTVQLLLHDRIDEDVEDDLRCRVVQPLESQFVAHGRCSFPGMTRNRTCVTPGDSIMPSPRVRRGLRCRILARAQGPVRRRLGPSGAAPRRRRGSPARSR